MICFPPYLIKMWGYVRLASEIDAHTKVKNGRPSVRSRQSCLRWTCKSCDHGRLPLMVRDIDHNVIWYLFPLGFEWLFFFCSDPNVWKEQARQKTRWRGQLCMPLCSKVMLTIPSLCPECVIRMYCDSKGFSEDVSMVQVGKHVSREHATTVYVVMEASLKKTPIDFNFITMMWHKHWLVSPL